MEGCRGGVASRTNLRFHFIYYQVQDLIFILEEGNCPNPC